MTSRSSTLGNRTGTHQDAGDRHGDQDQQSVNPSARDPASQTRAARDHSAAADGITATGAEPPLARLSTVAMVVDHSALKPPNQLIGTLQHGVILGDESDLLPREFGLCREIAPLLDSIIDLHDQITRARNAESVSNLHQILSPDIVETSVDAHEGVLRQLAGRVVCEDDVVGWRQFRHKDR